MNTYAKAGTRVARANPRAAASITSLQYLLPNIECDMWVTGTITIPDGDEQKQCHIVEA